MSIKERTSSVIPSIMKRLASKTLKGLKGKPVSKSETLQDIISFFDLVSEYDVIIMKHCFHSSDILEDIGRVKPSSSRQSLENYKAVYRQLREKFDKYPNNLFIVWTLPPRHRLFVPPEGKKDENAARATSFSNWLKEEYLIEDGSHPNISVWDFRDLVTDPDTNFLKYEYELSHHRPDSHPNSLANNTAGPEFAKFIVSSVIKFGRYGKERLQRKIMFLHHSTGLNVYQYPLQGLSAWFEQFNTFSDISYHVSDIWYPSNGNMPVHYYHNWLEDMEIASEGSVHYI